MSSRSRRRSRTFSSARNVLVWAISARSAAKTDAFAARSSARRASISARNAGVIFARLAMLQRAGTKPERKPLPIATDRRSTTSD